MPLREHLVDAGKFQQVPINNINNKKTLTAQTTPIIKLFQGLSPFGLIILYIERVKGKQVNNIGSRRDNDKEQ